MAALFTRFQITFAAVLFNRLYVLNMLKSCVAYIIASRDFQEAFVLRYKVHHTDAPFPIELNRELAATSPDKIHYKGEGVENQSERGPSNG